MDKGLKGVVTGGNRPGESVFISLKGRVSQLKSDAPLGYAHFLKREGKPFHHGGTESTEGRKKLMFFFERPIRVFLSAANFIAPQLIGTCGPLSFPWPP